jgi:hypothetical protein
VAEVGYTRFGFDQKVRYADQYYYGESLVKYNSKMRGLTLGLGATKNYNRVLVAGQAKWIPRLNRTDAYDIRISDVDPFFGESIDESLKGKVKNTGSGGQFAGTIGYVVNDHVVVGLNGTVRRISFADKVSNDFVNIEDLQLTKALGFAIAYTF